MGRPGDGGVADQEPADRPRDDIKFDVSYAKGTTKNVIATSGTSPSFAMFGGSGFGYQSVGFGATTDGVYMPGAGTGGIVLTTAWARGAFNHNWNPYWSTSLFGSYSAVRYDGGANDNLLGAGTTRPRAPIAPHSPQPRRSGGWRASVPTPVTPTSTSRSSAYLHPGQEPDVYGRSPVVPSRPEDVGFSVFTATAPKPNALYEFKDQTRSCFSSAPSVTSDNDFRTGPLCPVPRPTSRRRGYYLASLRRLNIAAIRPMMQAQAADMSATRCSSVSSQEPDVIPSRFALLRCHVPHSQDADRAMMDGRCAIDGKFSVPYDSEAAILSSALIDRSFCSSRPLQPFPPRV